MTETTTENAQLVADYLTRGWNEGEFDETVVSDEYTVHVNDPEDTYTFQELRGLATEYRSAFPDLELEIPNRFATDEWVAVRYQWSGTQEGDIRGIEATGRTVTVHGMGHFRVADGQLVESWYVEDVLGLVEQLRGEDQ